MTLRENIKELYHKNYTYDQIAKSLNCSKGTISYHCNPNVKQKALQNIKKQRKDILHYKLHTYIHTCGETRKKYGKLLKNDNLTIGNLRDKIGDNPTCYLTGTPIDLNNPKCYSLDHIKPISKGGQNSLENCGLTTTIANLSKSNMTYEEFVVFCRKVVEHYDKTNKNI